MPSDLTTRRGGDVVAARNSARWPVPLRTGLALLALIPASLGAQQATASLPPVLAAAHDSSRIAWERGDYVDALARWERLLGQPGAEALHRDIALVTGEWYPAVELAPDGRAPRWSADGRYLAFSTGDGTAQRTTVLDVGGATPRTVATAAGGSAVFAADGRTLYLVRVEETAALRAAQEELAAAPDANARRRALASVQRAQREASRLVSRDLRNGRERVLALPDGLVPLGLAPATQGGVLVIAGASDEVRESVLLHAGAGDVRRLSQEQGLVVRPLAAPGVTAWMVGTATRSFGAPGEVSAAEPTLVVLHDDGRRTARPARDFALAADGSTLAWTAMEQGESIVRVQRLTGDTAAVTVLRTDRPIASLALAPDGAATAFQMMPREDWELYVWTRGDTEPRRLTREIQHDLFPRFVADGRLLAVMGEARHRRSYLYDVRTGARMRLFHNDMVRTVAPEYEWEVSPDGTRVAIVAERDGDTISPERGLYLTDLRRTVTPDALLARVRTQLAGERALRERGAAMFAPVADAVRAAVADVSKDRIYHYADTLHSFGSKYIGTPGNLRAIEYLQQKLRAFGYEPELQWFEPGPNLRTANVVVRIPGTVNPELVYVASSHFDSVRDGPGADDNSSGTTALLEVARVLATRPQPATIELAFFTGEEAGLLGSREYVRRAVASGKRIVGALNNDMLGFRNDQRLDNTIRYSNAGLRDLQHAAAFLFTNLITYDAKYYKNTDAHAYYEAYGDIVAGIGSYPILGNPHYHQPHDVLETIDHQLVAEVAKTTAASLMLMASSPSRLQEVTVRRAGGVTEVSWTAAVERGVTGYEVAYGPPSDPFRRIVTVQGTQARLTDAPADAVIQVRAIGANGTRGWDWRRPGSGDAP